MPVILPYKSPRLEGRFLRAPAARAPKALPGPESESQNSPTRDPGAAGSIAAILHFYCTIPDDENTFTYRGAGTRVRYAGTDGDGRRMDALSANFLEHGTWETEL